MGRYSIKELDGMSELAFARSILIDRLQKTTNPYSPLSAKLRRAIATLEELDNRPSRNNWWDIIYTDAEGRKRSARDMPEEELERIARLVEEGFSCGEIIGGDES